MHHVELHRPGAAPIARGIATVRGPAGLRIEDDLYFKANKTLPAHMDQVRRLGRIEA